MKKLATHALTHHRTGNSEPTDRDAIHHLVACQRAYLLMQQLAALARELRLLRVAQQTGRAVP